MIFALNAVSQSVDVQIVDDTGLPVTGLLAATFPTLTWSLAGANADNAFPALSDLALITTAYSSGGVKERGNGVYRLDVPNAIFTAAGQVRIRGEATGKHALVPILDVAATVASVTNRVTANSDQVGGAAVAAGSIPNVAAGQNGGLPTCDANDAVKIQAGTGTGQLDVTAGVVKANLVQILATALTETAGQIAAGVKKFFNVATPTLTCAGIDQTGDSFGRIGVGGAGLTAVPDTAGTTTLLARLTAARAGYLDNLNVGGAVASHADVLAINQSASKHVLLTTVGQYAPGETYTVEARTFAAADGSAVNADSTPTLTATGQLSGNLNANLSVATNPATGVYRWTYTPGATPTLEQIRFDVSATISAATFTLSAYAQTVDEPTVTWTATDQSHLTSIFNKLPTNNIADETAVLAAVGSPMQAGSPVTVGGYSAGQDPATQVLGTPANKLATDATGRVVLQPTGLDAISVADPGGVANQTTFPKILVALYRRFFKKSTMTATQLKTFADDGATVNTTQALSDDNTTQTQGTAT